MTAIPAEMKAAHESILPFARIVARRLDTLYKFSICFGEALVCLLSRHEIVQVHMGRGQTKFATHRYGRWNFSQKFIQDCQYVDFIIIVDRFVEFILAFLICPSFTDRQGSGVIQHEKPKVA